MPDVTSSLIVKEIRITSLWVRTFPLKAAELWHDLWWPADYFGYRDNFSEARNGNGAWSLPWANEKSRDGDIKSHFWNLYLEAGERELAGIKAKGAWRHLAPFRFGQPLVKAKSSHKALHQSKVSVEGYIYPHGIGISSTIYLRCEASLQEAVTIAIEVNRGHWNPDDGSRACTLQEIAKVAGISLRQRILGKNDYEWGIEDNPYTVTTFVNVEGKEDAAFEDEDIIPRALEGLCLWDPKWVEPGPLRGRNFALSNRRGHVRPDRNSVYGLETGRVIWFPDKFLSIRTEMEQEKQQKRKRWLGRYHRNLSMATLQASSIISLLGVTSQLMRNSSGLPTNPLFKICRNAAGICGRMYHSRQSYLTSGVKEQIDTNIDAINIARRFFWDEKHMLIKKEL